MRDYGLVVRVYRSGCRVQHLVGFRVQGLEFRVEGLHRYLAHKKLPPFPRTIIGP